MAVIEAVARLAMGPAARTVLISVLTSLAQSAALAFLARIFPARHVDCGAGPVVRTSSVPRCASKPARISRSIRARSGLSKRLSSTRI